MLDRIISVLLTLASVFPYACTLYKPPQSPVRLPDRGAVETDASKSCGVRTEVRMHGGVPTLFVNGEPYPCAAYMTYLEPYNQYEAFADAGYSFFSLPVLFAGRWISTTKDMTPFGKGIFDEQGSPDFSVLDASVHKILDVCPDALLFPRVNLSMPLWWIEAHPDCLDGTGERESLYSDVWREDAAQMLRELIRHIRQSDYGAHIAGYQIAGGNTEEWFHFDMNGGISPCAEAGFAEFMRTYYPDVKYNGLPDLSPLQKKGVYHRSEALACFLEYANVRVADSIAYLAHVAKQESGNNVAVGTFYGYVLEVTSSLQGTHALDLLLDSPDVDFICSPNSYIGVRDPDADWTEMYAADSVRLHGKLCMQECDVRTHLTRPLCDHAPEYDPQSHYTAPIWQPLPDKNTAVQQIRKSFCRQLVKGNGFWWFDMWGGWYDDEDIMREMQTYREICAQSLEKDRSSLAQFAVFVDESAYRYLTDHGLRYAASNERRQLGYLGAPYDLYDVRDFGAVCGKYRAVLFLSDVKTPAMRDAVSRCRADRIPFLMLSDQKRSFSSKELRAFCRANGVHIYCDSGDVFYANAQFYAIHATTAGEKTIRLCGDTQLVPLLGDAAVSIRGDVAVLDMQAGETVLLKRK
ncbi:MAG: hypothetical protein IJT44_05230 [Clostridia bacterium]|nr:hypothetical protein [Clostridia bacterium]